MVAFEGGRGVEGRSFELAIPLDEHDSPETKPCCWLTTTRFSVHGVQTHSRPHACGWRGVIMDERKQERFG